MGEEIKVTRQNGLRSIGNMRWWTLTGHTSVFISLLCCDQFLFSCSLDKTIKVWTTIESGSIEVTYTHNEEVGLQQYIEFSHTEQGMPPYHQRVYVLGEESLEFEVSRLFKTELCNYWQETGTFPYGERCRFAHGVELRPIVCHLHYRTKVCRTFRAGNCRYGTVATFDTHSEQDEFVGPPSQL